MQLLLRLLTLGAATWAILKEEQVGEPSVDSIVLTKFLSDFMMLSVEDVCRLELQRAPGQSHTFVDFSFNVWEVSSG